MPVKLEFGPTGYLVFPGASNVNQDPPSSAADRKPRPGGLRVIVTSLAMGAVAVSFLALVNLGFAIALLGFSALLLLQYLLWGWWVAWLLAADGASEPSERAVGNAPASTTEEWPRFEAEIRHRKAK